MKKIVGIVIGMLLAISVYGEYNVGEVCDNISWTDNNGLSTSIYDQVDQGKAVVIFWGSAG